uniref:Uncharacterized protein n=1 Tax=Anguilla anguilla TaxID=7936 RepID=A0A0E9SAT1_ANGAN
MVNCICLLAHSNKVVDNKTRNIY